MTLLSIIVPVYNVDKYITTCLESILSQWKDDIEIICVNDGSTDKSLLILEHYKQLYPHIIIVSQPNRGLSAARNTGLTYATGEFIIFVDSDDFLTSNCIDTLRPSLEEGIDLIMYNAYLVDENGTEKGDYPPLEPCRYSSGMSFFLHYLQCPHDVMICAWSKVYNRKFLLQNKLKFEEGLLHEDNLFTPITCYYANSVLVLNSSLYAYRLRRGSITQTITMKRLLDMVSIANSLALFFEHKTDDNRIWGHILNLYSIQLRKMNKWDGDVKRLTHVIDSHAISVTAMKSNNYMKAWTLYHIPYLYVSYYKLKEQLKQQKKKVYDFFCGYSFI